MPSPKTFWQSRFPRLRYCIVWLAFVWMRLIVLLPLRLQLWLGRMAGRVSMWLAPGRRAVANSNLAACFPELSAVERRRLCAEHFEALGMSVIEMAMGWYGNIGKLETHIEIEGLEHLRAALAKRSGVILFSAHFTAFEIFFPILRTHCPRISGMYKVQRNPLMNEVMNEGRGRNIDFLFPKDNVRDMMRELRNGSVVWYASDQKYAGKNSALIPFFGVPAMTNTAISRIAAKTDATVLPYFCRRMPGKRPRYVASIGAPIPGFDGADPISDVQTFVHLLEEYIRDCPEQYWWIHKRFKDRPDSLPDIYSTARSTG
jgi:KDO2-lipid IV(A) lauroyltransferase